MPDDDDTQWSAKDWTTAAAAAFSAVSSSSFLDTTKTKAQGSVMDSDLKTIAAAAAAAVIGFVVGQVSVAIVRHRRRRCC